jgi:hypothetical protein
MTSAYSFGCITCAKEQSTFAPKIFCKQFAASEMVAPDDFELIIFGS